MHKCISPHGDYDHMGESMNLVNSFKVEKIIFNCGEFNDSEKEVFNRYKLLDIDVFSSGYQYSRISSSIEFCNSSKVFHN